MTSKTFYPVASPSGGVGPGMVEGVVPMALDASGIPQAASQTIPFPVSIMSGMAGSVVASDGTIIQPDSLAQTLSYDGSGNLSTTTVTAPNGNTYVQTLTWTSGKLTGVSQWVKQQ